MKSRDREALRKVSTTIQAFQAANNSWNDPERRKDFVFGLVFTRVQLDAMRALIEQFVPAERIVKPRGAT